MAWRGNVPLPPLEGGGKAVDLVDRPGRSGMRPIRATAGGGSSCGSHDLPNNGTTGS